MIREKTPGLSSRREGSWMGSPDVGAGVPRKLESRVRCCTREERYERESRREKSNLYQLGEGILGKKRRVQNIDVGLSELRIIRTRRGEALGGGKEGNSLAHRRGEVAKREGGRNEYYAKT